MSTIIQAAASLFDSPEEVDDDRTEYARGVIELTVRTLGVSHDQTPHVVALIRAAMVG